MHERHADLIDEANALASALTDRAIAAARRANAPEHHPDFDGETCVECGEEIPADRLALGKVRCVRCQTTIEHRRKQHAGAGWDTPVLWSPGGLEEA